MTKRSDIVYHGDLYIRHVHEVGYPTAEDRRAFNNRFYRIYRKRITNHREAITAVGNVHHFLKKETAPGWVKRIPALHKLFDEVLTDYKEKYGNGKGNEVEPKPVAPLLRVELRSKARLEKNRLLAEKKANSSFPATLADALAEQQQRYEEEVVLPSDVMVQPVTALQVAFFPELSAGSQQKYEMEGFSIQKSITPTIPPVQDERMEEMGVSMSPLQDEAPAANWLEQMEELLIPSKEEPKEEDFTVPGRKENRKETKKTPKKKTIEAIPVQNTVQQTLSGLTKVTIKKEVDEAMVLTELGVSRITEQGTRGIPLLKTGMRPVEEDLVRNQEARFEEEQLGSIAQLEEKIRKAIPVQETTIGQKNSAIETKPSLFDAVSVNQATTSHKMMGNTPAQMRIQQLEREGAEKEALFMEWKRKNEDEKKKAAERMARLEEELKAAQAQLATKDGMLRQLAGKAQVLTEKMELKDIIIRDKERTIQILSQQGKSYYFLHLFIIFVAGGRAKASRLCGHRCDDESGREEDDDVQSRLQTFRNNVDDCMTVVDEIVRLTEEVVRGGCGSLKCMKIRSLRLIALREEGIHADDGFLLHHVASEPSLNSEMIWRLREHVEGDRKWANILDFLLHMSRSKFELEYNEYLARREAAGYGRPPSRERPSSTGSNKIRGKFVPKSAEPKSKEPKKVDPTLLKGDGSYEL